MRKPEGKQQEVKRGGMKKRLKTEATQAILFCYLSWWKNSLGRQAEVTETCKEVWEKQEWNIEDHASLSHRFFSDSMFDLQLQPPLENIAASKETSNAQKQNLSLQNQYENGELNHCFFPSLYI